MTFCEALQVILANPNIEGIRYKGWRPYLYLYLDPYPPRMLHMHYPASLPRTGVSLSAGELSGEWEFYSKEKTDKEHGVVK